MATGTINVAIIGVGLVGTSVISQILSSPTLRHSLSIVSLQNSKNLLLLSSDSERSQISQETWKAKLASSEKPAPEPEELIKILQSISSASAAKHTVIVDNTSNDAVANAYPSFLSAGFSVVTPNKKAYSGPATLFSAIRTAQQSNPTALTYLESTVGAGLPIISTLKDLIATGDEIHKIEGVLSGTLSYIFNEWCPPSLDSTVKFSEVVKVAKEQGYTEPYPGDDLSGSDVARKLTILSRLVPAVAEAVPLPEGFASVATRSLTPAAMLAEEKTTGKNPDSYVSKLAAFDAEFDALREEAKKEGKVWRYVGVIDAQTKEVKASLEKYPATHPFAASLGGSDNIISFTTARYATRPLLVQGSGAGADVTAMGVVADLLKVAERRGV
ncbi:hypothetical protein K437DRAFT_258080 [Tilletiaria anomala UBC 951]|uniref:Homoserine dehydrogenase n=1 Tax=Tilletiaria anomala (strain ATCC 24038 / CBS 436.72 / UBC 951) TaxID=1037660 RepID=A0A066VJI1_TILAU|nr:uncharacterized protein K437DRAFT_258080 [Tilletiaria anomala UBC 951]KDN41857.1 hypothetical protein K437DRAFT_258080 [Tilletiaria anomala UBC 951]